LRFRTGGNGGVGLVPTNFSVCLATVVTLHPLLAPSQILSWPIKWPSLS
jgi:hypothetical protein